MSSDTPRHQPSRFRAGAAAACRPSLATKCSTAVHAVAAVWPRAGISGGGRRAEASALAMARAAPLSVAHAWARAARCRSVATVSRHGGSTSMALRARAAMC